MARERKGKRPVQSGKERHKKTARSIPRPANHSSNGTSLQRTTELKALKDPQKSKYPFVIEIIDNAEKKSKKINLISTTSVEAPPGYIFIPVGTPKLTQACKEKSRDLDMPVFIVTMAIQDSPSDREKSQSPQSDLDDSILRKDYKSQMNRLGYHFREHVVQIVMQDLRITNIYSTFIGETIKKSVDGKLIPEPLPPTQQLIYQQADAVIRDLFPRIPNTDRGEVLEHAFNMSNPMFKKERKVGLVTELVLARRVALAVLAHIRHTHTRYDELLKETDYVRARKLVEQPCLDILVKWRGDEETGRDVADEIAREVIYLDEDDSMASDSGSSQDGCSDDGEADDFNAIARELVQATPVPVAVTSPPHPVRTGVARVPMRPISNRTTGRYVRKPSRNFHRYELESMRAASSASYRTPPREPAVIGDSLAIPRDTSYRSAMASASAYPDNLGQYDMPRRSPIFNIFPPTIASSGNCQIPSWNQNLSSEQRCSPFRRERVDSHPHAIPASVHGQHIPPDDTRLRDMLVPSIEPPSPSGRVTSHARYTYHRSQKDTALYPSSYHRKSEHPTTTDGTCLPEPSARPYYIVYESGHDYQGHPEPRRAYRLEHESRRSSRPVDHTWDQSFLSRVPSQLPEPTRDRSQPFAIPMSRCTPHPSSSIAFNDRELPYSVENSETFNIRRKEYEDAQNHNVNSQHVQESILRTYCRSRTESRGNEPQIFSSDRSVFTHRLPLSYAKPPSRNYAAPTPIRTSRGDGGTHPCPNMAVHPSRHAPMPVYVRPSY